ncbi:ATP-binding protein [Selenomonas ruminantium]|uniref:ATP-binding protein n=1 Tax=Selenomonas ruminantium TaxID=971 RepID=UPI00047D81B8|nr:ATP-binding protein [Selenomonas ruminantium]
MLESIGKVIATEKVPTTIDTFCFWTQPEMILHPFDVVKVDHLNNSTTFGVIEEISHITDSASFLSSFISNDFGDAEIEDTTFRIGMNCVKAKVVGNTKHIDSPVLSNTKVYLATREEVEKALGLDNIKNPVCCGFLEMYEDAGEKITLPVNINSDFLIGPEGAHLNISGISGLAAKTSYAMFLLKSIQDKYIKKAEEQEESEYDDGVAFVVFNVKGKDLLAIDEINDFENNEDIRKNVLKEYEDLGLTTKPFQNVTYLYPASNNNTKNSYVDKDQFSRQKSKKKAFEYKFDYEKDKQNLDLMFANIDDPNQTMDAIINYIVSGQGKFNNIVEWNRFIEVVEDMGKAGNTSKDKEIPVMSWRKFARMIKKSISHNCLFGTVHEDDSEVRIADKIQKIKANDVYVVDMAKLDSNMQAFVFGNTVREIMDYQLGEKTEVFEDGRKPPSRIVIFIDELNKYASTETPKNSPIIRQILDIAERGRSLGVVLFGAEQFMSAIHTRVTGNCAAFAYGRTNAIEVSKTNYKYIPKVYQSMMTRLKPGEYIVQSFSFNSLLHIKFPLPIYRQFK